MILVRSLQAIKVINPYLGFSTVESSVAGLGRMYGASPEKSSQSLYLCEDNYLEATEKNKGITPLLLPR